MSTRRTVWPTFAWFPCTAASITTTKYLLATDFEFPLHLLLAHLTFTQLWQIVERSSNVPARQAQRSGSRQYGLAGRCVSSAATICLIEATLVHGYKSILYLHNLPTLVMVFSLDWQPINLFWRLLNSKLNLPHLFRYAVFTTGLLLIYICDFRLSRSSLSLSLEFLTFSGLLQIHRAFSIGNKKPYIRLDQQSTAPLPTAWRMYIIVPLWIYSMQVEPLRPQKWSSLRHVVPVIIINTVATVVAVALCPSEDTEPEQTLIPDFQDLPPTPSVNRRILLVALAGVVSAAYSFFATQPAILSVWQYCGYAVALLAFTTSDDLRDIIRLLDPYSSSKTHSFHNSSDTRLQIYGLLALIILAWPWTIYTSLRPDLPPLNNSIPNLDFTFQPKTAFDLVISRYDEAASQIARDVHSILETPNLENKTSRIFIYNKNSDTTDFQKDFTANLTDGTPIHIIGRENIGREGETYLNHILTHWDSLATHTLFMQAQMESLPLVKTRIGEFLIPETGFLSLSYEGEICRDCTACHDTLWLENPTVLETLFAQTNPGRPCRDLVMTYKGQFLVSAARIRGNERGVYEGLVRRFTDAGSWFHSEEYVGSFWHAGQGDSLEVPLFGYTLERMWGVVMQCSELRIGFFGPSLFGARVKPGWLVWGFPMDVVQCLDRPG